MLDHGLREEHLEKLFARLDLDKDCADGVNGAHAPSLPSSVEIEINNTINNLK